MCRCEAMSLPILFFTEEGEGARYWSQINRGTFVDINFYCFFVACATWYTRGSGEGEVIGDILLPIHWTVQKPLQPPRSAAGQYVRDTAASEVALRVPVCQGLPGPAWLLCVQLLSSGFHFQSNKSASPWSQFSSEHKPLCQVLISCHEAKPHQHWTGSARGGTRPTSVKGQIDHSAGGTTEGYTANYMHKCGAFITVKCSQNS